MEFNIRTRVLMALSLAVLLFQLRVGSRHHRCGQPSFESERVNFYSIPEQEIFSGKLREQVLEGEWVAVSGDFEDRMVLCRREKFNSPVDFYQIIQFTGEHRLQHWYELNTTQRKNVQYFLNEGYWNINHEQINIFLKDHRGKEFKSDYSFKVQFLSSDVMALSKINFKHSHSGKFKRKFEQYRDYNSFGSKHSDRHQKGHGCGKRKFAHGY